MRVARMLWLAAKHRDPAWVSHSQAGWVHRYRDGYVVTEDLHGPPLTRLEKNTKDVFSYHYMPKPGDVVVEVGAEFGTETLFLSRWVGPTGRVIAVEAHPQTCAGLREMVRLNGLSNVSVVHAAVGGTSGTTTITDGSAKSNAVGRGGIPVPARTLPELLAGFDIDRVDLLKVNIEGSERQLMASMTPSQADSIAHAVISCHDFRADRGDGEDFRTGAAVDAELARLGFSWTRRLDDPRPWIRDYRYASRGSDGPRPAGDDA